MRSPIKCEAEGRVIGHGCSELSLPVEAVINVFVCIACKPIFECSWYCIEYCIVCGMNDLVLQNADEGTSIKLVTC